MPIPQPQTKQGPKDAKQYLADLEQLLKRNTGSGLAIGSDVSSNTPMYLPGKVSNPTGLTGNVSSISQYPSNVTPPSLVERQPDLQYQLPQNQPQDAPFDGVSDFIQKLSESVYTPQPPTAEELEQLYQTTNIPYGIASQADGSILLNNGKSIFPNATTGKENAYPMASMPDGSILWSDGFTRQAPSGLSGVQALSQVLFNKQQTVTQEFGNSNPSLYGPGGKHLGTDFRVRDLENQTQTLPIEVKVIQVIKNGGDYGNSVLFQLATGEMVRLSHFDVLGNIQEGQILPPGTPIGVYGSTGNSTAKHLDVELYDSNGQLVGPDQFTAFKNPEVFGGQGTITGVYDYKNLKPQTQSLQPQTQEAPPPQQTADTRPLIAQEASNIFKVASGLPSKSLNAVSPQIASGINTINPTGKGFDLGITETLQGNPREATQKQRETISNLGTSLSAPDLNTKALSSTQGTNPFRQLAGNLVDYASTPLKKYGLPDTGLSEAIAGGKTVNTDVNLAPQASASSAQHSSQKKPQDYAGVLGQNVKDATAQAGEGLKILASAGLNSVGNIFKPKQPEAQREVGNVSGGTGQVLGTSTSVETPNAFSSPMDTASSMQSLGKNDIRDPFFKSGASMNYQSFLKPNADQLYGGALTLDLFNPEFYQSKENISNVFGGSSMQSTAEGKYNDYVEAERKRQIEEQKRKEADMQRRPNEIYAEWMKRTGQQSSLDSIRSNPRLKFDEVSGSVSEIGQSNPSQPRGKFDDSGRQMSVGPQMGVTNAIRAGAEGKVYISPSGNPIYNYTPGNANATDVSTGLPFYSAPPKSVKSNNIFSKAKSLFDNIFRR